MDPRVRDLVETLWNYHKLNHDLTHADAILVLCSHDTRVAERGAQLYLQGLAPLLIFSGGLGSITRHLMTEPEATQFARIAMKMGVPEASILVENQSTNTGENVRFTKQLLESMGTRIERFILVQKPYMERRTYATFKKVWPEPAIAVTSPQVSMTEYLNAYSHDSLSVDDVIAIMVGDLQRIRVYADKGFQIPQDIPEEVWKAYEELVRLGYDSRLVG